MRRDGPAAFVPEQERDLVVIQEERFAELIGRMGEMVRHHHGTATVSGE
jgi:hypothetical protein